MRNNNTCALVKKSVPIVNQQPTIWWGLYVEKEHK